MAHQWRGVIEEYARPPAVARRARPVVTLRRGRHAAHPGASTSPRSPAPRCWLKFEGLNPTGVVQGPRHDDGDLAWPPSARRQGRHLRLAPATPARRRAAYATKAGMTCAVLVPDGKIAMGKLSQAIAHGATLLQVDGNFDDCLTLARKLAEAYPVELVNSVNPARIEGQKTAAFEVVDALGDAPDIHCLPVGNAGNITAYWQGYREYRADGATSPAPATQPAPDVGLPGRRRRADRARATRSTTPRPSPPRSGSATPRRGSRPSAARDESGGLHRRGHRRADPRGAPPAVASRRASSSSPASARQRRRPARRAAEAGLVPPGATRRLHGHRPRPQGPAVGAARPRTGPRSARSGCPSTPSRAAAGPRPRGLTVVRPGRRLRRRASRRGARAREQRQPRPGLRLDRPGPRALGRPTVVVADRRARAAVVAVRGRGPTTCRATSSTSCTARCWRPGPRSASTRPRACAWLPQRGAARPWAGLLGDGHRRGHRCGTGASRRLARHGPATTSPFDRSLRQRPGERRSRGTPTTPRPASTAA